MKTKLILASNSPTRKTLLSNAGISFKSVTPNINEEAIKVSSINDGIELERISEILADYKAKKISSKHPSTLVIGCDQIIIFNEKLLSKLTKKTDVLNRLYEMNNKKHDLYSSAAIYLNNQPIWHTTVFASLKMRNSSEIYLRGYVNRNYNKIVNSPGCYMIEGEGIRLFEQIIGDYFSILGIPLIPILNFLNSRGEIQ